MQMRLNVRGSSRYCIKAKHCLYIVRYGMCLHNRR